MWNRVCWYISLFQRTVELPSSNDAVIPKLGKISRCPQTLWVGCHSHPLPSHHEKDMKSGACEQLFTWLWGLPCSAQEQLPAQPWRCGWRGQGSQGQNAPQPSGSRHWLALCEQPAMLSVSQTTCASFYTEPYNSAPVLTGVTWHLLDLIFIVLMTSESECLFICLSAFLLPFLGILFSPQCPFLLKHSVNG